MVENFHDNIAIYRYIGGVAHVSKKHIQEYADKKITEEFAELLSQQKSQVILSLFTPTERVMLAKRLAIIGMVVRGYSTYRIAKILSVSDSTVRTYAAMITTGGFESLQRLFSNAKRSESLWKNIEYALRVGLPPVVGNGRWQSLRPRNKR